jgi:hypothetical protein
MEMVTKAKTKAQRRYAKRGRPCKRDVARNDNGRIYEPKEHQEAPDVLARRKRVELFGGSLDDAGAQNRGTVIGRLMLSKEISEHQHSALQRFGELAARYRTVMCVPDSLKKTSGGSAMSVPNDDREIEIRGKWRDVTRAVNDANTYHTGNLMGALQFVVIRDEFHEHLVGDVRIAANALVRYYGIS